MEAASILSLQGRRAAEWHPGHATHQATFSGKLVLARQFIRLSLSHDRLNLGHDRVM